MKTRFLTPKIHGILDYVAAAALIAAPFWLGLKAISPLAHWLSITAGALLILYSLATDYPYSVAKVIPFKMHLLFDLLAGAVFLVTPYLLKLSGAALVYFAVMGMGVILLVLLTNLSAARRSAAT